MKRYLFITILALIGVFNAVYLSIPAYEYWNGVNSAALQMMPCDLTDTYSCSSILKNPRAIIFTIPFSDMSEGFKVAFPMIAMVVYPVLFLVALWGWLSKNILPAKILTVLSGGGILFNAYVIYQEYIVGVFCPLCAICTVIIILIFSLSLSLWNRNNSLPQ